MSNGSVFNGYIRNAIRNVLVVGGAITVTEIQQENRLAPETMPYVRETFIGGLDSCDSQTSRTAPAIYELDIHCQTGRGDTEALMLADDIVRVLENAPKIDVPAIPGLSGYYRKKDVQSGRAEGEHYIVPVLLYIDVRWLT